MKIYHYLSGLIAFVVITASASAQNQAGTDSTGLPGDNFSLQGALAMFQKASSPEDFEKLLNSKDNHVNNLDLNGDGNIDYIRVIDNTKKNAHALVLQAVVSDKESQDVAVIEIEKSGDTTAVLQIVGDEDLYGDQVIVEPGSGDDESAHIDYPLDDHLSARGPNAGVIGFTPRLVVNVWLWPSVRFIYAPIYRPWISPWRWEFYPVWWTPWRPFAWHVWHPFYRPYYAGCAIVRTHRVVYAHSIYVPHRVTSVTVRTRNTVAINNYRVSRSKTVVTGPRGHHGYIKTRTSVTGPRGNTRVHTNTRRH